MVHVTGTSYGYRYNNTLIINTSVINNTSEYDWIVFDKKYDSCDCEAPSKVNKKQIWI